MKSLILTITTFLISLIATAHSGCPTDWGDDGDIDIIDNNYPPALEVLNRLADVYGNRCEVRPKIKVTKNNEGPKYKKASNTIYLNEKTIQVCRAFKKDSLSALALIIGHELAHFYQENFTGHDSDFHYLMYDKQESSTLQKERLADVQGVFNAFLAGYKTKEILGGLIKKLYHVHGLTDELNGYPSLKEREETTKKVLSTVDSLIQIFDAANYMTALGQYELAASCYHYILGYYPGREIYNNLGVNKALQAMHCTEKSLDPFSFPFELDTESRLKKPRARSGADELPEAQHIERFKCLLEAEKYLEKAKLLDPDYLTVDINLMCVKTLLEKPEEAIDLWDRIQLDQRNDVLKSNLEKAKLAYGIALYYSKQSNGVTKAEEVFCSLKQSDDHFLASMASANLAYLESPEGTGIPSTKAFTCIFPKEFDHTKRIDGYPFPQIKKYPPPISGITFSLEKLSHSSLVRFWDSGIPLCSLQHTTDPLVKQYRIPPPSEDSNVKMVQTKKHTFLICEEEHAILLFNANGELRNWGKFYKPR